MQTLRSGIDRLKSEIAALDRQRHEQEARLRVARADIELVRTGGEAAAHAHSEIGVATARLRDIEERSGPKKDALATLEARAKAMADPVLKADADHRVAEALNLRGQIDRHCKTVATKADALADALRKLADAQDALRAVDADFDRSSSGHASVVSWIVDKVSFYFGSGGYTFRDNRPELPGSLFTAPSTVEDNIRRKLAKEAAALVRARELGGAGNG